MPTLADIYSAADSFKRRLTDAASNPSGALSQMLGYANDRARAWNEQSAQNAQQSMQTGEFITPQDRQIAAQLAESYNPAGITFQTGKPITFPFIKNTEKAPKLQGFGQDIEPHGNYVLSGHDVDVNKLPPKWVSGEMEFKNPLVIDWGKSGLYSEPDNWKQVLANQYGKKGKSLSKAIAKEGYDGIVTTRDGQPSEIVDLSSFVTKKPQDYGYRGSHTAPGPDFGAPLHDLTGGGQMYPSDVYSASASRIYGTGYPQADREAFDLAKRVRGNPNAEVTMYRAVPKDESIKSINPGDWVSLSKSYAQNHGESVLGKDYKIISQKVKAKDLWTNADSIHEFGYHPSND